MAGITASAPRPQRTLLAIHSHYRRTASRVAESRNERASVMGGASSSTFAIPPDDVVTEILLRVQPEPIYLLRISLVCRKWRRLARDPAFLREFRARRRNAAPLVGFFYPDGAFVPSGDAADRVAAAHFSQLHGVGSWRVSGARHGRVLLATTERERELEFLVWDPMTGARTYFLPPRHVRLAYPAANGLIYYEDSPHPLVEPPCLRAALICDHHSEDDICCHSRPFRVVVLFINMGTMFASVYSSQAGAWGRVAPVNGRCLRGMGHWEPSSVLVADCELFWPEGHVQYLNLGNRHLPTRRVEIPDHSSVIFGYNFETNWLMNVKGLDVSHDDDDPYDCLQVFRDEFGELGLAAVRGSRLHLFEPVPDEDDEDDAATWSEYRDLDLDALLPPPSSPPPERRRKRPVGFDEDGNTIFLETENGVFSLQLESLEANKVLDAGVLRPYTHVEESTMIPYMSFFVPGVSGGNEGVAQQNM